MILIPITNRNYDADIRDLFDGYLNWLVREINRHWDAGIELGDYLDEDMRTLDRMLPPHGRFYLAQINGKSVGVGAIKQLDEHVGEIKRMYTRPEARGLGVGKMILDQLLEDGRSLQYKTIYLDSPKFCQTAQSIYQSRGFQYIDGPYPGNENDRENDYILNFMQLTL